MTDDRMTLAALRVRAGYSQRVAAAKLGVNRMTLAKWEQNSSHIPVVHLEHLVNLYQAKGIGIFFGEATALSGDIKAAYDKHVEANKVRVNVSEA